MKILFLDSYYENVIESIMGRPDAPSPDAEPDVKTKWLNEQCHGTADYWERAVKAKGHEAWTIVVNTPWTPSYWVSELYEKIDTPDVVVYQNVSDRHKWQFQDKKTKKVAFCSYRANREDLIGWDAVFTSFPHKVEWMQSLSPTHYLQLAFDPIAEERTRQREPNFMGFWGPIPQSIFRSEWLTFAGGIGYDHIWKKGNFDVGDVAQVFKKRFKWWGYGPIGTEALEKSYQGNAWGTDYFKVLLSSKITLNRHGEIAEGYGNNMRLYEASGCGCCLVTNACKNMPRILRPMHECIVYTNNADLVRHLWILHYDDELRKEVAAAGRKRCLAEHTYAHRAVEFLDVLENL